MKFILIRCYNQAFGRHYKCRPAGGGTGIVGGGAPIGRGMVLLIVMAAGYGGKKVYDFKKRNLVD